jgi:uncharacterized membrane protein YkoI
MAFHLTRKQAGIVAGAVVLLGLVGTGAAIASNDDDGTDTAITGSAYDQAAKAALAETGGGKVTGTEVGDEESYYEVEVTLDNGQQVDVQLDKDFHVVSSESDGHGDAGED